MKKILIALDYDPPAEKVAMKGFELAKSMNAQVILLHVVAGAMYYSAQNYSPIMGFEGFGTMDMVQLTNGEELKKAAQNYLNMTRQHLGDDSIQTIIKEGEFSDGIIETAREMEAAIIVMGSHGRRGLDKILLGSVAEQVLHKSDIPLYIIPTKKFEKDS